MIQPLLDAATLLLVTGVLVYVQRIRPPWLRSVLATIICAPLILVVYNHAAQVFGVRAEWWLVPSLLLVSLPFYSTILYHWTTPSRSVQRQTTTQMGLENVLDEWLAKEKP